MSRNARSLNRRTDLFISVRVTAEDETMGLDLSQHAERLSQAS